MRLESNIIKSKMNNFTIIGIDDKEHPELPEQARAAIVTHHVFSGGKRHHEIMRDYLPEDHLWIDITVPLDDVFHQYENHPDIVVFASGDPLFFGFANTVLKRLPDAKITLIPMFNSLQTLAHRILLPYHDMHVVSLTGRPWHEFDRALIEGQEKIGVLTDREHTPGTTTTSCTSARPSAAPPKPSASSFPMMPRPSPSATRTASFSTARTNGNVISASPKETSNCSTDVPT